MRNKTARNGHQSHSRAASIATQRGTRQTTSCLVRPCMRADAARQSTLPSGAMPHNPHMVTFRINQLGRAEQDVQVFWSVEPTDRTRSTSNSPEPGSVTLAADHPTTSLDYTSESERIRSPSMSTRLSPPNKASTSSSRRNMTGFRLASVTINRKPRFFFHLHFAGSRIPTSIPPETSAAKLSSNDLSRATNSDIFNAPTSLFSKLDSAAKPHLRTCMSAPTRCHASV